ncbi:MAG: helix-turn-helix transcriptional regulator [Rhizomicrobium sp.]
MFYRAAAEPDAWPEALTSLAGAFDATAGHLIWWNKQQNKVESSWVGGDHTLVKAGDARYNAHYGAIDPRRKLAAGAATSDPQFCQTSFDETYVERSEIYQDFLIPFQARYSAITKVADDREAEAMLAVVRSQARGAFADDEMEQLRRLMPHVSRAAWLYRKFSQAQAVIGGLRSTLDLLDSAVVLVGRDGRVMALNRAAERLLTGRRGLRIVRGRLQTEDDGGAMLTALIEAAQRTAEGRSAGSGGSIAIRRAAEESPLYVTIAPLAETAAAYLGQTRCCVALFLNDPGTAAPMPAQRLSQLFGLTSAEARVAVALAGGHSPDAICDRHRVSKNTVRAQMRAIFAKTGTRRQIELVSLLRGLFPG